MPRSPRRCHDAIVAAATALARGTRPSRAATGKARESRSRTRSIPRTRRRRSTGSGAPSGGFATSEAPSSTASARTQASAETVSSRGPRAWRSGLPASTGSRSTTMLRPVAGWHGPNASSTMSRRAWLARASPLGGRARRRDGGGARVVGARRRARRARPRSRRQRAPPAVEHGAGRVRARVRPRHPARLLRTCCADVFAANGRVDAAEAELEQAVRELAAAGQRSR